MKIASGLDRRRLRAVTPATVQRATLQIDGHADPRAVVHGEGVDVEDRPVMATAAQLLMPLPPDAGCGAPAALG